MKNDHRSLFGRIASICLLSIGLLTHSASAQVLDNGVEPANLGKGDWIYFLSSATNKLGGHVNAVTNVASLMAYEKSKGMDYVIVKAGDSATPFPSGNPQFTTSLVNAAHAAGLKIFSYNRSWGTNVPGEITLATNTLAMGADGFVIDAEIEWESSNLPNNAAKATQLCQGIKAAYPTRFLAHSPFPIISSHSSFPYKEFGFYCDAVMPQDYWKSIGYTPTQMVNVMETEWRNWQNSLSGTWTNAIKPIVPAAQAWSPSPSEITTGAEIIEFVDALKNSTNPVTRGGYRGVNYWRADLHTADMWSGIDSADIGGTSTNAPVITGVSATSITDDSAIIIWTTQVSADSIVEYGTTTSYGSTATDTSLDFDHSVTVSGLAPSTTYHYRVKSKNASLNQTTSGDFTFTTAASGSVSDIIIDNPAATVVGSWSTGSSSTDKFGTDYRFKSQGTGAAYLQFTPNIAVAGDYIVYEWHPIGGNRTVGAPHVINFNGGTQTVNVNQQVAGGQWNVLGTFNFAPGTAGNVRITDAFADAGQVVLADAIKFEFVPPPPPPAAPSGLSATAISASRIDLTWTDNSSDENNFIVARSTTSGGPYTDIATLGANVTSYNNNTGLSAGTTYYYVVRASNTGGSSVNSAQASATTLQVAPAAPSGLSATAVSSSQINLSWTDNSNNEDNFIVARSTTSGGPYTDIVTLGANVTSYNNNTGLSAGTTYYYVVRASNSVGSSANSAQASATTTALIPNAPSGLVAQAISASQISLTWVDNSGNESSFIVARSTTAGGPYTDIVTASANSTSFTDSGLTASTTYYYVVRAHSSGGDSANSNESGSTTYVTDLLIDNVSAVVVGSWSSGTSSPDKYGANYLFKSQGTGAAYLKYTPKIATAGSYAVYAWYPQGSNRATNAPYVINYNGGSQTVTVNQQINGGQWNLLGTFNFAAGSSGNVQITDNFNHPSAVLMADAIQFIAATPPSAPSGLVASAVSKSQINLTWTDNSNNEANMVMARSTTSGGPYTDVATLPANSTSYSDTGLTSNTTYYYIVKAVNGAGSASSAQASAKTLRAVHVQSITMTWVASGSKWKSRATVNVVDAAGATVNAATVTGNFTGAINNSGLSATTGSGGNAAITSTSSINSGTVTFTVTGITGTNMEYDSSANVISSKSATR